MNLSEIVSAIEKSDLENASQLSEALTKLFESNKKTYDSKVARLESSIENLTAAIGIDADGNDLEGLAKEARLSLQTLIQERDTALSAKKELQQQIDKAQRSELINKAASISKASPAVLDRLIADSTVAIDGDRVLVDNVELKQWATTNHSEFIPALYPKQSKNELPNTSPHLSAGTGNSKEDSKDSQDEPKPIEQHVNRFYQKPKFAV